jgi:hypothetical protein
MKLNKVLEIVLPDEEKVVENTCGLAIVSNFK